MEITFQHLNMMKEFLQENGLILLMETPFIVENI